MSSRSTEMLNDFRPETADLLATLRANGFRIFSGSNGEEFFRFDSFPSESAFLAELLAADEATLRVTRTAKIPSVKTPGTMVFKQYFLYLVMGNSPGELVCDYGIPADSVDAQAMETATNSHSKKWTGRKQPQATAADLFPSLPQ